MDDLSELQQLVLRERLARDHGRWDELELAWDPAAPVWVSWYRGDAAGFITASREMSDGGTRARHRMGPPVVHLQGDRAVVEAPAVIEMRAVVGAAEVDLASRVRLLFRATRSVSRWHLAGLVCVYERETVVPVSPGTVPETPTSGAGRASYRWLATLLESSGHAIADDLPGEDLPETVSRADRSARAWLVAG